MDWVIAALSLNNIADLNDAFGSIRRVLKSSGRLVFTVPHPCFDAPHSSSAIIDEANHRLIGDYFGEGFWRSTHPHSVRRAGNYHRTIGTYVTTLIDKGFALEVVAEPAPNDRVRATNQHRAGLPPFLLIRAAVTAKLP